MENDINISIEEFKLNIIKLLNNSNMPIGIMYYVMKDVFGELTEEYQNYLNTATKRMQEEAATAASEASQADSENIAEVIED